MFRKINNKHRTRKTLLWLNQLASATHNTQTYTPSHRHTHTIHIHWRCQQQQSPYANVMPKGRSNEQTNTKLKFGNVIRDQKSSLIPPIKLKSTNFDSLTIGGSTNDPSHLNQHTAAHTTLKTIDCYATKQQQSNVKGNTVHNLLRLRSILILIGMLLNKTYLSHVQRSSPIDL